MNPPTNFNELLPYILATLAPYLISGAFISQALQQFKFINNPDDPKTEWPAFAKIALVYGVCLVGVALNNAITGVYIGAPLGSAIQTTFIAATSVAAGTQVWHLSINWFFPSLGDWLVKALAAIRGLPAAPATPPPITGPAG